MATPATSGSSTVATRFLKSASGWKLAASAPAPSTSDSAAGMVTTPKTLLATTRSSATAALPLHAVVRVTHVDRVVGTQQNTARPRAISGGRSGAASASGANAGVSRRMAPSP